jgi:hypothetical protein
MHQYTGVKTIDYLFSNEAKERLDEHGNRVLEIFYDRDRYLFDFAPGFLDEWMQFDTDQDAHYFGTWINKERRFVLSYCEGDISLVLCKDDEHFDAEVGSMCQFYTSSPAFVTVDEDGTVTKFYQEQREYFIDPARARAVVAPSK